MATPKLDYDKAARGLVDAILLGDTPAATRHGVSQRTIENWRAKLKTDGKLVEAFGKKVALMQNREDETWLTRIPETMKVMLDRLRELMAKDDVQISEVLDGITRVGDLDLLARSMEARLAATRGKATPQTQPTGAGGGSVVQHPSSGGA